MTSAVPQGTDVNNLLTPGDYSVYTPANAWTASNIHLVVLQSPNDPRALLQRGRLLTGDVLTYERIFLHGVWGDWAVMGAATAPVRPTTAPTITSISPTSLVALATDTITLTGTGFVPESVVYVEDLPTTGGASAYVSPTSMTRIIDSSVAGLTGLTNLDLVVVNPDGKRSNGKELAITA